MINFENIFIFYFIYIFLCFDRININDSEYSKKQKRYY